MSLPDKGDDLVCAICGRDFVANMTTKEALDEAKVNGFGDVEENPDEYVLVCHDCYLETPWGKGTIH